MKIETKFNIGELAWFMHNNKATSAYVYDAIIKIYNNNLKTEIKYTFSATNIEKLEENMYKSKEELINSL